MNYAMSNRTARPSRSMISILVALFILIPGLLTACTGIAEEAESENISLIQLETEVAYLDHELDGINDEMQLLGDEDGTTPITKRYNYDVLIRRKNLLRAMREDRSYALEEKRMEEMVTKLMDSR